MHNLNVLSTLKEQKYIALVVLTALVMWSVGVPTFINRTDAANLASLSNTLSESNPEDPSIHTIEFTSVSEVAIAQNLVITYPVGVSEFVFGSLAGSDVSTSVTGGGAFGTPVVGAGTITIPVETAISLNAVVRVVIGDVNFITNGDAGSYEIEVALGPDSGKTRVVIIDNVTMTASVETIFTFSVSEVADAVTIDGSDMATNRASTATTIPFGVIDESEDFMLAQLLEVRTNSTHGYVVTVEQDQNLTSSTGSQIHRFQDADPSDAGVETPIEWAGPAGTLDDYKTYGHYGITTTDAELAGHGDVVIDEFRGPADLLYYVGNFHDPRLIMAHDGPTLATYEHAGWAHVGFRLRISGLQPAANDYTNTITYIATPTF